MLDIEDSFAAALTDVDVNRAMIIAVKEEAEAILGKDCGHGLIVMATLPGGNIPRSSCLSLVRP